MKFLCLIYEDPQQMQRLPKAELDKVIVASRIPGARFGSVEVRPIHQYPSS